jgi:hypothetical protein
MKWVLVVGSVWVALAVVAAFFIAGAIRVADRKAREEARSQPNVVLDRLPVPPPGPTADRRDMTPGPLGRPGVSPTRGAQDVVPAGLPPVVLPSVPTRPSAARRAV